MNDRRCSIEGCQRRYNCRGFCEFHKRRLDKYGHPLAGPKPRVVHRGTELERFWAKVDLIPGGCWEWTAALRDGYGRFNTDSGRMVQAHRYAWEHIHAATVPDGLVLDHLCMNTRCVSPLHLEPVRQAVNTYRAKTTPSAVNSLKTHCKRGHEFNAANTWIWTPAGSRHCRTCRATQARQRRAAA